jgi:hypothetical protein
MELTPDKRERVLISLDAEWQVFPRKIACLF